MINHARTLLANVPATYGPMDWPADSIYVDPYFTAANIPPWLDSIRHVMLGTAPEPYYLFYCVDQWLKVVHGTDYASYLTQYDSRLTYDTTNDNGMRNITNGIHVTDGTGNVLSVTGVNLPAANDAAGIAHYSWEVVVNHTGLVVVTNELTQQSASTTFDTESSSFNVDTPDGGQLALAVTPTETTYTFYVSYVVTPSSNLATKIAAIENLGGSLQPLFGVAAVEPYITFYGLFAQPYSFQDKVAGLVLAVVQRTHEQLSVAKRSEIRRVPSLYLAKYGRAKYGMAYFGQ